MHGPDPAAWYAIWTRLRHERVVVRQQPLRGIVGRLVRKGPHARLFLSVNLIGQGVSVDVDAADVRSY